MLIRREDFGNINELTKGSYRKVWFTCESCGIGILQTYSNYLKQKEGKFCRSCRNKHTMNKPERKLKAKQHMETQWQDEEYKKNISKSLSKGCKKAWKKDDGTRSKIVSEITSNALKEKWKDNKFIEYQKKVQKETHNKPENIEKHRKISKKQWENKEYRKQQSELKKGKNAHNKYTTKIISKKLRKINWFLLSEYLSAREYILVCCNKKHIFKTIWNTIQQEHGCPYCLKTKQYSKPEKEIAKYIKSLNINIIENNRNIISPLELDIVIPEHKLAIEHCGTYHHSEALQKNNNYHLDKLKKANEAGYRLITIFGDEWLNKKNIVKKRLRYILGLEKNKIYARKCDIKEIDTKKAKEFIDKHHIQGYGNSIIKLGAFYNNKLVAVMTFSKPSLAKGRKDTSSINKFELNRFCTSTNIIGIASKLLKYFQRNYEWKEIYSYADRRWSEGNLYEKIGMKFIKNTKPNYWYRKNSSKRHHRFEFRKDVLKNKLEIFDPNKTEYQNMKDNKWDRIWDCGNKLYSVKYQSKQKREVK